MLLVWGVVHPLDSVLEPTLVLQSIPPPNCNPYHHYLATPCQTFSRLFPQFVYLSSCTCAYVLLEHDDQHSVQDLLAYTAGACVHCIYQIMSSKEKTMQILELACLVLDRASALYPEASSTRKAGAPPASAEASTAAPSHDT